MKTQIPNTAHAKRHDRGFALVVTLSLMILLTVIAVGLLGLSAVSLRTSSQQVAISEARANARLALMLALGDLQKYAGPDQRITATADVLGGTNAKKGKYTGVWLSDDIEISASGAGTLPTPDHYNRATRNMTFSPSDPLNPTYEEKKNKFIGWLASSDFQPQNSSTEVGFASAAPTDEIELWGANSVGTADKIFASKIKMTDAKNISTGRFAYAVTDEGVKARINTRLTENTGSNAAKTAQLGAGTRASTTAITGLNKLERDLYGYDTESFSKIRKGISWKNHSLAADSLAIGTSDALKPLYHDVTTISSSVLANVAAGGLKRDLNLIANSDSLPSDLAGKGVYQSILGITGVADPRWESLHDISKLYREDKKLIKSGEVPVLKATVPTGWTATTGSDPLKAINGVIQKAPPKGAVLMPSIVSVRMIFSLLARDIYKYDKQADGSKPDTRDIALERIEPRGEHVMHREPCEKWAGTDIDYILNLQYTPVVTLHNPYNVALEFTNMRVVFANVPFGLKIYRNGVPMTTDFVPIDRMYKGTAENGQTPKRFGMLLKNGKALNSNVITLLPGEVIVFSPNLPAGKTYQSEFSGDKKLLDWGQNNVNLTQSVDAIPGWKGDGNGFSIDWLRPAGLRANVLIEGKNPEGYVAAAATDTFNLEFKPLSIDEEFSGNQFTVEVFARQGNKDFSVGALQLDYGDPAVLLETLPNKAPIKWPDEEKTQRAHYTAKELHDHSTVPISGLQNVKPFAMITAHAKTTSGGFKDDNLDGQFYAKPWAFAHAPMAASYNDLSVGKSSFGSHEFQATDLVNGTSNLIQSTPKGISFFITGLTSSKGLSYGSLYDIPLGPLQSMASLNSANPGGSSGYLPRFAQPIGNSWAHPIMNTKDVQLGDYLDHSYLLNRALYDNFYFSGFGKRSGVFGNNISTNTLATNFINSEPLDDPRLVLYNPDGKASDSLKSSIDNTDFYKEIAAWQMLEGGFNINSTSKEAWKAMLSSTHDPSALFNSFLGDQNLASLRKPNFEDNEVRISRFRLPAWNSAAANQGASAPDLKDRYWLGAREYSAQEIDDLADNIVKEIKKRGPFLSLSDFVNRPLGSGDQFQRGVIQEAIDVSKINDALATNADGGKIDATAVSDAKYGYANPDAAAGSTHQGAPGFLSQADIISVLGNAASPRSDTFTIRGYGESRNKSDQIVARATCEAVVQRLPEYVDSTDTAHKPYRENGQLNLTATNQRFGRKFVIVSFRWLNATEI